MILAVASFLWLMIHFETPPICHFYTLPKWQISLPRKYKKGPMAQKIVITQKTPCERRRNMPQTSDDGESNEPLLFRNIP